MAFSDGVIAVIITIMVLEPQGTTYCQLECAACVMADIRELRTELCLCRRLSGEPSSSVEGAPGTFSRPLIRRVESIWTSVATRTDE